MMQQTERIPDTQVLGLEAKHSNVCLICGALLTTDENFQALHMSKEHGLEV